MRADSAMEVAKIVRSVAESDDLMWAFVEQLSVGLLSLLRYLEWLF